MASFSYTVDTTEMAEAVESVSGHVNGTTAAVVGMQAAVIKAELDSAEEVCHSVNRGFHALMLSQVSQKAAKAKSAMDAKLMELAYQAAGLRRIREQLGSDFNRIAERYTRLFKSLDNALRARVYELDQRPIRLAEGEMGAIQQRGLAMGPKVQAHQAEALPSMQALVSGEMKRNAALAVGRMAAVIRRTLQLKQDTRQILAPGGAEARAALCAPVALFEGDDLGTGSPSFSVLSADPEQAGAFWEVLLDACRGVDAAKHGLAWQSSKPELRLALRSKCLEHARAAGLSEREQGVMMGLFEQSDWLALPGQGGAER